MKAKRGRHKTGRDKVSTSFAISLSQIDWLNEHPEINQSQLISSLLAEYIEAFSGTQPEKVKLIFRHRALKKALEKADTELESTDYAFRTIKYRYEDALKELKNYRYLAQLPIEQLSIGFDELNNPSIAWVSDKNSTNMFQNVTITHGGLKEPAQIHAALIEKLKYFEGTEYQNRLEKLKQAIELPESVYKTFKQQYENISKQIAEIEGLIVKQE